MAEASLIWLYTNSFSIGIGADSCLFFSRQADKKRKKYEVIISMDDREKVGECLDEVTTYLEKLGKSRGIQIGLERKLKEKIKETKELLEKD